jgi:predicted small secreted protein
MRLIIALSFLVAATLSLSACNTVDGLGRDMESAGRSIQNM